MHTLLERWGRNEDKKRRARIEERRGKKKRKRREGRRTRGIGESETEKYPEKESGIGRDEAGRGEEGLYKRLAHKGLLAAALHGPGHGPQ